MSDSAQMSWYIALYNEVHQSGQRNVAKASSVRRQVNTALILDYLLSTVDWSDRELYISTTKD